MIKTISLEGILRIISLKDREYLIKETDHDIKNDVISAILRFKGKYKNIIYVGSREFNTWDNERAVLCLDEHGLPYKKVNPS